MALIQRGGCTFYIRSVRRGGKVTSEYLGSGPAALLMAEYDAILREQRAAEAAAEWNAERARLDGAETALAGWCDQVEVIARAALALAGYHQHKRQWKKRRMSMSDTTAPTADPARTIPATRAEGTALMDRARRGDATAMPALRALLDARPDAFRDFGDMARQAEWAMLDAALGDDLLAKELMARNLERITGELAGPNPGPIERLLARRAALCWFAVHWFETAYAQSARELTLTQGMFHQRRIDRAHHRLLSALRTLALVRRVPLTAVQVNVGTVNLESPAPGRPAETGLRDRLGARAGSPN